MNKIHSISIKVILFSVILLLLNGCMYPDEQRSQGRGEEYLTVVQFAIDQYREQYGVLPIYNFSMDTPIYEQYVVDFKKLLDSPYLSDVPPNAFENGGTNRYVLINAEENPEVRLLDLITSQQINDLQRAVDNYMLEHQSEAPLDQPMSAGWYTIDFDKLGMESMQIRSVFSGRYLSLFVNKKGRVIIDYGPDIMTLINEKQLTPEVDKDLRMLLAQHSIYVPVKSVSYYWRNEEPAITAG